MTEDTQISLFGHEDDPEVIDKGERAFHNALFTINGHVDPAFSFIMYRFNRVGVQNEKIESVCYADKDGIPTIGVNYAKFGTYSPIAQIGVIEHNVGHFMSGHIGNRMGKELRDYCKNKYGSKLGNKLYYMTIEAVADMFVTYPQQMKKAGLPHYDINKIGLNKKDWPGSTQVLHRIEELVDELMEEGESLEEALNSIGMSMLGGEDGAESSDDGDGDAINPHNLETGGAKTKDYILNVDSANSLMAENNIRDIIKKAVESTEGIKNRGWMSGDAAQFIESEDVQPVVPWFQQVNQTMTAALAEERRTTRKRLNRRDPDFGFGRIHRNKTKVVFIIDTSGSMGKEDLKAVDSQLNYLAQLADEVDVIHCDAGVAKCEEYRYGMRLETFFGRGGTSFAPALEYVRDELDYMPDAVIYFTDGYGEHLDDSDPIIGDWETRLIWVLTPNGMSEEHFIESITASGEVIKVEEWT